MGRGLGGILPGMKFDARLAAEIALRSYVRTVPKPLRSFIIPMTVLADFQAVTIMGTFVPWD